jgi:hypothetical protein
MPPLQGGPTSKRHGVKRFFAMPPEDTIAGLKGYQQMIGR